MRVARGGLSSGTVGLVGCGTVGSGVVRLWSEPGHAPGVALKTIAVRDLRTPRLVDVSAWRVTNDAWDVVRDPEIRLVVEATGDTALAHGLALACFETGKSFVTAGKSLVARFGPELEERAAEAGVGFFYEAAVGGALPVVGLLRHGLSPGGIRGFEGVLNGTCNFILSRLGEGLSFPAALAQAQARGFAEEDSRRDTSGLDAAEKLVILARLCGVRLDPAAVPRQGIDNLRSDDVVYGRRRGWALKLIARFQQTADGYTASVAPTFVPEGSLLAHARDEENVIVFDAGAAGSVTLVGRGAGSLPTAAAILSDVREALSGAAPGRPTVLKGATLLPKLRSARSARVRQGVRVMRHPDCDREGDALAAEC
jgi:homoserine dehydrogenase